MKVQKFPQSHLVIINSQSKKLVIDPGYLTFEKGFKVEDFQGGDVYLITHVHEDHLGPETIKDIIQDKPIFGNADVIKKLKEIGVLQGEELKNRQQVEVAGFKIEAVDLPHFPHPLGKEVPPNSGFIIDKVLFHAGDGFELEGLSVENGAIPIGHPFLSTTGVLKFAKSLGVKVLIPVHYDAYPRDPEELKKFAPDLGIEVRILNFGEETSI